jgi:hypothetical protein
MDSFQTNKYLAHYLDTLKVQGAVVVERFLKPEAREALLREYELYTARPAKPSYGKRKVPQDFTYVDEFPIRSRFRWVACELAQWLNLHLYFRTEEVGASQAVQFTDLRVQRYACGSKGIGVHQDGPKFINFVALFVLEGTDGLYICDDASGTNPRPLHHNPGDLILMRSRGLFGAKHTPYHFVDPSLSENRMTFGLRQHKAET